MPDPDELREEAKEDQADADKKNQAAEKLEEAQKGADEASEE